MTQAKDQALWAQPIPIIGATGEVASGKTVFAITICPGPQTLHYDLEKSAVSYEGSLGFKRVDVFDEMLRLYPKGHKPVDLFLWWLNDVRSLPKGQYRVIVVDTASEIEAGLVDWVEAHPEHFGHSKAQYQNMNALMWGDVKEYWKAILTEVSSRCETFVFITHMASEFGKDKKPTGKKKPKGKETLKELASLYLQMEREKDAKGNVPDKPAATVLKSRLMNAKFNAETGDVDMVPTLPPRLPIATPAAIRKYMATPPDYGKLKKEERIQEQVITDDERAAMKLATAEAERDAEQLRVQRLEMMKNAGAGVSSGGSSNPGIPTVPSPVAGNPNPPQPLLTAGQTVGIAPATSIPDPAAKVGQGQLQELARLREDLFKLKGLTGAEHQNAAKELWANILAKRNVTTARDLTNVQWEELMGKIGHQLNCAMIQEGIHGTNGNGGEPAQAYGKSGV